MNNRPHPPAPSPLSREGGKIVRIVVGFLIVLLLLFPTAAWAEQTISVNDVTVGPATEDDFIAGGIYIHAQPIFWQSDVPWRITVRSATPNLGVSDNGTYVKLLSDLRWKLSDDVTWTPVTQEENEVEYGTGTGDGVIYLDFVLTLDWLKDIAGNYGAELVFTIEAL